jgi:hypothetical protein
MTVQDALNLKNEKYSLEDMILIEQLRGYLRNADEEDLEDALLRLLLKYNELKEEQSAFEEEHSECVVVDEHNMVLDLSNIPVVECEILTTVIENCENSGDWVIIRKLTE